MVGRVAKYSEDWGQNLEARMFDARLRPSHSTWELNFVEGRTKSSTERKKRWIPPSPSLEKSGVTTTSLPNDRMKVRGRPLLYLYIYGKLTTLVFVANYRKLLETPVKQLY